MIDFAIGALIGSLLVFIGLLVFVHVEQRRGRRFFAGRFRSWLDKRVSVAEIWILRSWEHFIKYIVQLNWYYSIHSILKTLLRIIVGFYTYFENVFERNRARAKQLRAEKRQLSTINHLRQMADHKEDTALTTTQKEQLRHDKLEETH